MTHVVTLSNKKKLVIEEGNDCLHIASGEDGEAFHGDVAAYICEINRNGVLVMPNSGPETDYVTCGLIKES